MSPPSTTSSSNGSCPIHQEIFMIWCDSCTRSLCRLCLVDHSGHSFQYLKGNGKMVVGQLLTDAREIQRNIEETLEIVNRMGERVEARVLSVANEVRAVLHHHIRYGKDSPTGLMSNRTQIRDTPYRSASEQFKVELR